MTEQEDETELDKWVGSIFKGAIGYPRHFISGPDFFKVCIEPEYKKLVIKTIKDRIASEYDKHKRIDWQEIAAAKIYADLFTSED